MAKPREEFAKLHPSFITTSPKWRNLSGNGGKFYITIWTIAFYRRIEFIDLHELKPLISFLVGIPESKFSALLRECYANDLLTLVNEKYAKVNGIKKLHRPVRFKNQKHIAALLHDCNAIDTTEEDIEEEEEKEEEEETKKKRPSKKDGTPKRDLSKSKNVIQRLLAYFGKKSEEKHGKPFAFSFTKDMKRLKEKRGEQSDEAFEKDCRERVDVWFSGSLKFAEESVYDFGAFIGCWNQCVGKKKPAFDYIEKELDITRQRVKKQQEHARACGKKLPGDK